VDRANGIAEALCGDIMPKVSTPCTQLVVNDNLYIIYPEKKQCCRCCSAAYGCKVQPRNWLQNYTYVGTEVLSGQ